MDPSASEERLLELALSKNAPDRLAFLEGACVGDEALRDRILERLRARLGEDTILDTPGEAYNSGGRGDPVSAPSEVPGADRGFAHQTPLGEGPGSMIGRYKLLQEIGEGGCGTVFMAEQEEPVRRRVALKVIKLGMDTKAVVARFDAERQALAMMEHPNIARVLDAGATASGRPYFVMELVKGIPITRHCDEHELSIRDRLQLYIQVCHAIQHAHQKGIIHRDIKPSNVLVTLHDGVAVPKVIDFGIAKATEGRLTDQTLFTAYEQFIGTPAYMSPEQAAVSGLDIDTRSDIYSLGVLLYELLTGRTPFDARELAKSGLDVLRRTIREVEPQRPSTRLVQTLGAATRRRTESASSIVPATEAEALAMERRRVQLKETLAELRGDLDWIVMKCLEKDRTRRYETANGLAADLRRYLDQEPVLARPPSNWYRLQKTFQRNQLLVMATTGIVVALLAGIAISLWQATAATRARDRESLANDRLRSQVSRTEAALRKAEESAAGEYQQRVRVEALLQQLQIQKAEELFGAQHSQEAVAVLGGVLRTNPSNAVAAARLVSALTRPFSQPLSVPMTHDHWVSDGDFSSDGTRVATGSWDGTARIWNAKTGEPVSGPLRHGAEIRSVQFSPDGQRLVTCSGDRTARIWDAWTGGIVAGPLSHEGRVRFARFLPEGGLLMTVSDHSVRWWDARTGDAAREEFHTGGLIVCAEVTPLGVLALVSSNETWKVIALDSRRVLSQSSWKNDSFWTAEFSPDGRMLAFAGSDGAARIAATETGLPVGGPMRHGARIRAIQFSPDGRRVATGSEDGTARVWNVRTGVPVTEPMVHGAKVRSVAFSPDGTRIVTASDDKSARIWDSRTGRPLTEPLRHGQTVNQARFSPDGLWVMTASDDRTARIWSAQVGQILVTPLRHDDEVRSVAYSPDGNRLVTASDDGTARIWDSRTSKRVGDPLRHNGAVLDARFSPDGRTVVTSSQDKTARLWDSATGKPVGEPLRHDGPVVSAEISPDGLLLVTASTDRGVRLWEVSSGRCLHTLRHGDAVNSAHFSPDGRRVVTASEDRTAVVWEVRIGRPLGTALRHELAVNDAAFDPGGTRVVTASRDRTARVWDAATGLPVGEPMVHENAVLTARFSPDGVRLVTASDGVTVGVWDPETGRATMESIRHEGRVRGAWFSPDGSRILTASVDHTARLWDSRTGLPVAEPFFHGGEVSHAQFSPDGAWVATASLEGCARLWECPPVPVPVPGWFLDWAEAWVGRRFGAAAGADLVPVVEQVLERERVAGLAATDFFTRFAQWVQSDPGTRRSSPSSSLTVPDIAEDLLAQARISSRMEAVRILPRSSRAWARLASLELAQSASGDEDALFEANFSAERAVRLDSANADAQQVLSAARERMRH
ncbi:MAG: protein kinase [Verrucomicrobiota bacterium]